MSTANIGEAIVLSNVRTVLKKDVSRQEFLSAFGSFQYLQNDFYRADNPKFSVFVRKCQDFINARHTYMLYPNLLSEIRDNLSRDEKIFAEFKLEDKFEKTKNLVFDELKKILKRKPKPLDSWTVERMISWADEDQQDDDFKTVLNTARYILWNRKRLAELEARDIPKELEDLEKEIKSSEFLDG
jgi:hypothetical protein